MAPLHSHPTLTRSTQSDAPERDEPGLSATVLWHPRLERIGARADLRQPIASFSRIAPVFDDGEPLEDVHVSRTPLQIVREAGGARAWPGQPGLRYALDGQPGAGGERISAARLEQGALLRLGDGALLLVESGWSGQARSRHGMIGRSRALELARQAIDEAAALGEPALILGESGTGKELVARALHAASGRKGAFVAINMAAIPHATAVSQLFGHARGAFTGAERAAEGWVGQAEGGTLFLDEIGACSVEIQAQLLRLLERREVQPVGGAVREADVQFVAATDEDLDAAVGAGAFRRSLYYRLARRVVRLPPLAARPADIATLAVHFFREELARRGAAGRLTQAQPWLGRGVIEALLAWRWPGNVRELSATISQLCARYADAERCGLPDLQPAAPPAAEGEALEAVLRRHEYVLQSAARELEIGINTLKRRMLAAGLPRPSDVTREQLAAALAECGTAEAAAARLRISAQGLKLRAAELGLPLAE